MERNKSIEAASTRHINVERVYGGRKKGNIWEDILKLSAENGALNMALGFPDFAPPGHVVKALEQVTSYSDHMIHHYTRASGHLRFCMVLGRLYSRLLKRDVNPMTDILTTTGAYDALFTTFQALICPGDEVILIEPCYEPYMELARLAGATVKYVPLIPKQNSTSSDDWVFDLQALQAAFNTKTKAIVVNTPMNPLGKVFNRVEMQAIADLCVKHDTLCFADEVYQWLVYGNRKHIHIATLDGMAERTINIGSAGKTFSVTGWKTGWAVGPTNLMDALQAFHHLTIRGGCSVLQEAVAIALEKEEQLLGSKECYFYQLSNDMQNKRDQLLKYLEEADLNPVMPGGGYFIVADISKLDSNINKDESIRDAFDINFVKWAIVEKKFTVIPLSIFYSKEHQYLGEKYIRICFAKTDETLKKAKAVLTNWNESKPSDGVVIQNGF